MIEAPKQWHKAELTGWKGLALKQRGCRGWKESQVTGTGYCTLLKCGCVSFFPCLSSPDHTASIISQRREGFSQDRDQEAFSLVLVVADGGEPPLSSTATLSLRVCVCQRNTRGRHNSVCQAEAFLSSAGLSTGAFVAIMLCIVILISKYVGGNVVYPCLVHLTCLEVEVVLILCVEFCI